MTTIASPDPIIGQPDGTQPIDVAEGALPHLWHVRRTLDLVADGHVALSPGVGHYEVDGVPATATETAFIDQLVDSGYVSADVFGDIDGRTVELTTRGRLLLGRWRGLAVYTSRGGGRCG